jgi:energy-coupling factor transporter ATP-binding protein EcfA2
VIETVAWDKPGGDTPMLATMTPQEAISQQRPQPSECDIVIVVFWARMGTPLPDDCVKPNGQRYRSGTEWEFFDAYAAAQNGGVPDILVYRRMETPIIEINDPAFKEKRLQWELVETFFDEFRNQDGSIHSGFNEYDTPDTFENKLTTHLRERVSSLLNEIEATAVLQQADRELSESSADDPVTAALWKGSPFPGLRPFGEGEAPIYFGRGRETDGLLQRLARGSRFLAVIGASGSGKSSLVAAGLLPRLQNGALTGSQDWLHVRITPGELGEDPFLALAIGFKSLLDKIGRRIVDEAQRLRTNPQALEELTVLLLDEQPHWSEIILFADQLEELFTTVAEQHRRPFAALLARAANIPRLRTVVTLRADFYHRFVRQAALAELLRDGSFPLAVPGVGALLEMITRPAERAGLSFEEGLPERILDDTGDDAGALPLLAFALEQLYLKRDSEGRLNRDAYEKFGGVQGAISQLAEGAFTALDTEAQSAFANVFRELLEVEFAAEGLLATRRVAALDEVTQDPAAQRLVSAFLATRLLRADTGSNNPSVIEVAHEALLQEWPRLSGWITASGEALRIRSRVRREVQTWVDEGRPDSQRWKHDQLAPAREVLNEAGLLTELEKHADTAGFLIPEAEFLLAELLCSKTDHARREAIGMRLAEIGDPRNGVSVVAGIPDILWREIPGMSLEHEGETYWQISSFRIAAYPVTYAQLMAFIDAEDGYNSDHWWTDLARNDDSIRQTRRYANYPADDVSWECATAFCRWLSKRLGYRVRLPDEKEWIWAATSADLESNLYPYPWGRVWHQEYANTAEAGLGRSTAVGMYPNGSSLQGVFDLAGNVSEWCRNDYRDPRNTEVHGSGLRVLHGGSWINSSDYANPGFRYYKPPEFRPADLGFRVLAPLTKD